MVLDAASLDAGGQPRADLLRQLRRDLLAQEAGYFPGVRGQHRLTRQHVVQRHQRLLAAEHQVSGILGLPQAPVVGLAEHVEHRAQPLRVAVQPLMQHIGAQRVGYGLCTVHIGNAQKGVVGLHEPDALALERTGHGAVAIAVELQAERCPGRDPEVAQPEFVIDEVEVVVQTLARLGAQVGLAAALVVPRLVARAGLHRRDDVHQPGCIATRLQHACHQIFLADVALVDVLDLDAGGSADLLRAHTDAFAQRFGEPGVVEYANAVGVQKTRHARCVARAGQRARDQDSVKARQHAVQIRRVTLNQIGLHGSLRHRMATQHIVLPVWFRLVRLRVMMRVPASLS